MADPSITVVIPTISRPQLARCLASLVAQDWRPGDEVLLVGDGPQPIAREVWAQFWLPGRYLETPKPLGCWGHGVRNWVQRGALVKTSHRMQLDDDDIYLPHAVHAARTALTAHPDAPHLFCMDWTRIGGKVLWEEPVLREGNVGTPMLVARNYGPHDPPWGTRYAGDFDHIRGTCELFGAPVWCSDVICVCRPHLEKA